MLTVCSKNQVRKRVKAVNATHLITMLDPGDKIWRPSRISRENHLWLAFEDEEDPNHKFAPTEEHCVQILAFAAGLPSDSVTVVHCFAGMCRSTASALAIFVQKHGLDSTWHARQWLLEDRPQALPNMLMAKHFDNLLNANGKFWNLCNHINNSRLMEIWDSPDW